MPKLPVLLLCCALAATAPAAAPPSAADEAALTAELAARGESCDPALFAELAGHGTPAALAGLCSLLERLESVFMRRELLRAIASMTALDATQDDAIEALVEALRSELDPLLRASAIEGLSGVPEGREALLAVADDPELRPEIRLEALRGFVASATEEDVGRLSRLGAEGREREPAFRATAMIGTLRWLSASALAKATKHELSAVRVAALSALVERGDRRAEDAARRLFEDHAAPTAERLFGARAWLATQNDKVLRRTLEAALRLDVPEALALGVADAVSEPLCASRSRFLANAIEDADERERRILLRAARRCQDPELDEAFLAALAAEDPRLVREAANGIAARRQLGAADALLALLEADADGWIGAVALSALASLHPEDDWTAFLLARAADPRTPVRNAALRALRQRRSPAVEQALVRGLESEDWTTRLVAARELERLASPGAVGALCRRIGKEEGRPLHELAAILWRLTGEPHGTNARAWGAWWAEHGEGFRVLSPEELARREAEREERLLRRTSRATFLAADGTTRLISDLGDQGEAFFGLRVISRRVVFAIDVSTSMNERLDDPPGDGVRTRLDLARRELLRILDTLDPATRFRLVAFAGRIESWSESLRTAREEELESARAFVAGLQAAPATNFYDTLRLAFADPQIDTIYLLSDGDPSLGDVREPSALRATVREWNRFRGIVIHCISIGADLELLRGLAADSGGAYLSYR